MPGDVGEIMVKFCYSRVCMFLGNSLRPLFNVLCLGLVVAGCSSLDEDTPDHLDFALPSIVWTVSTDDPQWHVSPSVSSIPRFVCAGPRALATDCCAPPWDCQRYPLACDPTDNFCALTFEVQLAHSVDLVDDVDAVAEIQGRVVSRVIPIGLMARVELDDGLPVRSASLFVGPAGLADSSDSAASLLAPIDVATGVQALVFEQDAQDAFSNLARDYRTPFSLLLTAHVVVPDGFQSSGDLQVTLDGLLRAYY